MRRIPRYRAMRGFTLLELLIAMSLVSLILVLLFGGLRLGARSWESLDRHVDSTEELRLARGLIQRMLLESRRVYRKLESGKRPLFFGASEQLEMVTPLSDYLGVGGLYLVRIYLEREGDRKVLMMERWLLHPDVTEGTEDIPQWRVMEQPSPGVTEREHDDGIYGITRLAADVGELSFSYFGAVLKDQANPRWFDEWDDSSYTPLLVRIHLVGEGAEWPDLTVRMVDG